MEALLASVDDFDAAHPKPPPPPPGMDYQMAGLNAEAMRANGETIAEVNAGLMTSKGTVPSGTTKGPTPKTCKLCFANNRPPDAPTALNVRAAHPSSFARAPPVPTLLHAHGPLTYAGPYTQYNSQRH